MRKNPKKNYSISKKLKLENRIDEDFEARLNNLSLEDIIALKLELSSKTYKGKFYGLQLYKYIQKGYELEKYFDTTHLTDKPYDDTI